MKEMQPRSDGSLWSPSLESWLVPDEHLLRLYDDTSQMRLTHEEATRRRAEAAERQLLAIRQRTEDANQRAADARQQTEKAIQQAQIYAEKLRSMGIDSDQVLRES